MLVKLYLCDNWRMTNCPIANSLLMLFFYTIIVIRIELRLYIKNNIINTEGE